MTMHDYVNRLARRVVFPVCLLAACLLTLATPSIAGDSEWAGDRFGTPADDANGTRNPSLGGRMVPVKAVEGEIDVSADRAEVTIFTTRGCRYCRQAKAFFKQRGIPFDELAIDTSERAKAEFERLKGRGVPLIVVRGQVINGFSEPRVSRVLAAN